MEPSRFFLQFAQLSVQKTHRGKQINTTPANTRTVSVPKSKWSMNDFFQAWYHLQTSHCSTDDGSTLAFEQTRAVRRAFVGSFRFVSLTWFLTWAVDSERRISKLVLYLFQVLVSGDFFWEGKMCGGVVGGHVPFSPRCLCFFFLWTFSLCVFLVTCDAGTRLYIIAIQQANLHGNGYLYIYRCGFYHNDKSPFREYVYFFPTIIAKQI